MINIAKGCSAGCKGCTRCCDGASKACGAVCKPCDGITKKPLGWVIVGTLCWWFFISIFLFMDVSGGQGESGCKGDFRYQAIIVFVTWIVHACAWFYLSQTLTLKFEEKFMQKSGGSAKNVTKNAVTGILDGLFGKEGAQESKIVLGACRDVVVHDAGFCGYFFFFLASLCWSVFTSAASPKNASSTL